MFVRIHASIVALTFAPKLRLGPSCSCLHPPLGLAVGTGVESCRWEHVGDVVGGAWQIQLCTSLLACNMHEEHLPAYMQTHNHPLAPFLLPPRAFLATENAGTRLPFGMQVHVAMVNDDTNSYMYMSSWKAQICVLA